jgi:hypothetical protein
MVHFLKAGIWPMLNTFLALVVAFLAFSAGALPI